MKKIIALVFGILLVSLVFAGSLSLTPELKTGVEDSLKRFVSLKDAEVKSVESVEQLPYNTMFDPKSKQQFIDVPSGYLVKANYTESSKLSVNAQEIEVLVFGFG